ncbi:LOW QUALITY PROTEIN: mRNA decay activator protein ZFP36L1 [Hypomesus transpacificus]|uniref:LOW QUALITY PROTEIN: mRNA decay activator protein ZFP36L1 n=1 Tax=Hypomesus transpacificus TaxID=137520 RepID=UPI001F080361|nr:LOW QUALITY PROTEIN: mRNA decay activator protein ZFP36L1 [Hypomesus transpacificus]
MPSNFLTPFLELDEEFCKNFHGLDMTDGLPVNTQRQRVVGFQRRHSLCPVTLPNSKFNNGSVEPVAEPTGWPLSSGNQQWSREFQQQLPRSSLNHIPFRVDRSVSMIEGNVGSLGSREHQLPTPPPLMPPPGLSLSTGFLSSSKCLTPAPTPPLSTRYKTELCRTYEESGTCKYGSKCQFAHGMDEVRGLSRHPKYKTEPCRTFHTIGFCPYGSRCHFVHNNEEQDSPPGSQHPRARERPQLLRQSISFAGFSSSSSSPAFRPQLLTGFQPLQDPLLFSRASSVSPPPSTGSPELLSPLLPEPAAFRQAYPFSSDLGGDMPGTPRFYALTDSSSKCQAVCGGPVVQVAQKCHIQLQNHQNQQSQQSQRQAFSFPCLPVLHRCSSAESLTDLEGYSSSSSLSGSESPSFEGRRLPIFSRLSVSDD